MNLACIVWVKGVENLVDYRFSESIHWLSQNGHKSEPIYFSVLVESFLEGLQFELLQENAILLQYFIELLNRNNSSLIIIVANEGSIDSPKIRIVFVFI